MNQLKKAIDPEVWNVRYEDLPTIGARWSWERRRDWSTKAAERVHALLVARA